MQLGYCHNATLYPSELPINQQLAVTLLLPSFKKLLPISIWESELQIHLPGIICGCPIVLIGSKHLNLGP